MSTEAADRPIEIQVIRRRVGLLAVVGLIYFSVSGGPYGLEESISSAGPGMTMLMLLLIPIVFAVPCSLMAAELGSSIPLEGGYYYWVKVALGRFAAFCEGAWQWLTSFLDTALYPVIFADYIANWIPGFERGNHVVFSAFNGSVSFDAHWVLTLLFMAPLVLLNVRGARVVGDTSATFMFVILTPFVILTVLGIWKFGHAGAGSPIHPFVIPDTSPSAAFGAALGVIIWNYIGWESVSTVVGEIEKPRRTYPRALAVAVPLITISYVLPMIASLASGLHSDDPTQWTDGDFAEVGRILGGEWLFWAITIGAVIAQVGLFSSLLMSGSRVPMVLAGDGYLPPSLARTSPKYGTPVRAIVVSALIFSVFTALDFTTLIDADVLLNLMALLLMFVSLIVLRVKYPNMNRPYRVPGGMFGAVVILVLPLILTIWLFQSTYTEEPGAFWIGIVLTVFGGLIYWPAKWFIKRGRPDADVEDLAGMDLGEGIDVREVVEGRV
jgi:amino acid transporter